MARENAFGSFLVRQSNYSWLLLHHLRIYQPRNDDTKSHSISYVWVNQGPCSVLNITWTSDDVRNWTITRTNPVLPEPIIATGHLETALSGVTLNKIIDIQKWHPQDGTLRLDQDVLNNLYTIHCFVWHFISWWFLPRICSRVYWRTTCGIITLLHVGTLLTIGNFAWLCVSKGCVIIFCWLIEMCTGLTRLYVHWYCAVCNVCHGQDT